ncbi:MAG: nucleotidyltransferase family protein [Patescibacteria group bacterium]
MNTELKNIRVIILAGGLGTRLQTVIADRPKVLAPIKNKTLLDYTIDNLLQCGFRDIMLSVGHMKDKMREHMKGRSFPKGTTISFSEEESPLGTGGAIKKAINNSSHEMVLVLNGDTFFPINYDHFLKQHIKHGAHVSICLSQMDDTRNFGTVTVDENNRIMNFKEKTGRGGPGLISGGMYIFGKGVLNNFDLPETFSIEKDFFEKHIRDAKVYGFVFKNYFIDIGTPESYEKARNDFDKNLEGVSNLPLV